MTAGAPELDEPTRWEQVRLVAGREIRERGGSRSYLVSTVVTVVLVLAMVAVPAIFFGDDDPPVWELAVIGETPDSFDEVLRLAVSSQGASVELVHLPEGTDPDGAAADSDAVLVDGFELVSQEEPPDGLRSAVSIAATQARLLQQLADAGLEPEEAAEAITAPPVEVRTVEETEDDGPASGVAFIGVIAMFIAINSYGAWVLTGVLEEKSSRVVEVIVSAMPARALLAGKVLGIGVLGIGQLLLTACAALAAAVALDVTDVPLDLLGSLVSLVVWFVLGFAFYAVGYAAAGSLVSRQEDAQSAASPLAYIVLASYFISIGVITPNPEALVARVLSFVPFLAPMAMPPRIAQGAAEPWEIAGTIVAMLLGIWLMVRLASRIYEQSLLRSGAPIKMRAAVREALASRRAGSAA
ncbi:MAG: ABC transporter permease [Acidimicrobiia bacterium]|nr:ABC transporter permease [Acidimicrobiia bacterium]